MSLGPSGIVQAKAALAQGFTNLQVFEMQSDLGGIWYPNEFH